MLGPWKKSYEQPRQHIKKQRHYFANKGPSGQSYGFSSSHVWMWELDYKESWPPKIWCFWTMVLEKTFESPLDCKEIKPIHPKGLLLKLKLWYFGHLMWRADSLEKTLMLGKIESRRRRGQQRMRWLDGITWWTWVWAFSGSWWWTGKHGVLQLQGHKELDTTEHWTEWHKQYVIRSVKGIERDIAVGYSDSCTQSEWAL